MIIVDSIVTIMITLMTLATVAILISGAWKT